MIRCRWCLVLVLLLLAAGCGGDPDEPAEEDYADRMAEEHAEDSTGPTGMVQEPAVPVMGEEVEYAPGVTGYLAAPEDRTGTALPGLIVIHEWWGLNDNIRAMTERLAGEGYRALAVDLYGGEAAQSPDQARQLMQEATQDQAALVQNLKDAYGYLTDGQSETPVGIIGWCFGGGMSLQGALAMPSQLDAAVIYYGNVSSASPEQLAELQMPILGLFGAEDQGIPVSNVHAFEQTLDSLGKQATIQVYDGANHAFANPTGDRYQPEAAEDAWQRTVEFMRRHLNGGG